MDDWKNKYYDLLASHNKLEDKNSDQAAQIARLTQVLKDNNINGF